MRVRSHVAPGLWPVLLALATLQILSCDWGEAVAPDDASMTLSIQPAAPGVSDTMVSVRVVLVLKSGDLVPYGATVTFQASAGAFCPDSVGSTVCASTPASALAPAIKVVSTDGVALTSLKGLTAPDTVVITAKSGAAAGTVTIKIPPPPPKAP